ncbi:uncharacterized protein LOC128680537 isoform X2 [Plodia interpunctella]|uniref:uncharacterized protein LOC128680537 isoform X2 n=1 Tax=Plodia interpunctella TaxID=58824 RepID=UPI002368564D|nr:uncharacterized protein LOC128680537 isoform X2 [Plodia interpunctella]
MVLNKVIIELLVIILIDASVISEKNDRNLHINDSNSNTIMEDDGRLSEIFDGVYTDCFLYLSYSCLQKKTLVYLKELNKLREVSVIGNYVKFVKLNATNINTHEDDVIEDNNSEKLSFLIDDAIDKFFDSHIIKFSALGKNISVPNSVDGFVGRKKRKGGGGGGMGHGGGHDHDDGGKKKMMMMAMMCMKMKLMMMVPAMMGMMGMMSFKGMMFSMMSFMISKMMLLMKILEKKGIGGGSGGGDAGWAAGGGGGGAWMPAGGQDYGGAGGYDANGQWQSRSIIKRKDKHDKLENEPIISYIIPTVTYNNKDINNGKVKSRKKRGIMDVLQNVYLYWINQILGASNRRKSNNQRYRIVNGVKYVYYPNKVVQKAKTNHASSFPLKNIEEFKPIIISDDFNKGETVEGGIESRMNTKKFHKMKDVMNDTFSDNPWE